MRTSKNFKFDSYYDKCRICLEGNWSATNKPLTLTVNHGVMYTKITHCKFNDSPDYSQVICKQCVQDMRKFIEYRDEIGEKQKILNKLHSKIKIENSKDDVIINEITAENSSQIPVPVSVNPKEQKKPVDTSRRVERCQFCNEPFAGEKKLIKHIEEKHFTIKPEPVVSLNICSVLNFI